MLWLAAAAAAAEQQPCTSSASGILAMSGWLLVAVDVDDTTTADLRHLTGTCTVGRTAGGRIRATRCMCEKEETCSRREVGWC